MRFVLFFSILVIALIAPPISEAQPNTPGFYRGVPYGHYCPGRRGGGPYGARVAVATSEDARKVINSYFESLGQKVTISEMRERRWFFLADILDAEGRLADRVIVDKRTGRIRSIY